MIQPVAEHAAQQIGTAQERTVGRSGRAQHEMIAAAGAAVAPVEHEFLGAQARQPRLFVKRGGVGHQFRPIVRRMDVDLDHAGVRRDLDAD